MHTHYHFFLKFCLTIFCLMIFCFLSTKNIFAQKTKPTQEVMTIKEKSLITDGRIEMSVIGNKKDLKTAQKPIYTQLYVRNTDKLFLGNGCSEEFQQLYGVEYVVVPPRIKKNKRVSGVSNAKYFWNNTKANFKLFWRNGFFWKSRMLKKIKDCSVRIGDIEE